MTSFYVHRVHIYKKSALYSISVDNIAENAEVLVMNSVNISYPTNHLINDVLSVFIPLIDIFIFSWNWNYHLLAFSLIFNIDIFFSVFAYPFVIFYVLNVLNMCLNIFFYFPPFYDIFRLWWCIVRLHLEKALLVPFSDFPWLDHIFCIGICL